MITQRKIEQTFHEMHSEGQGVWQFALFSPPDMLEMLMAADNGDERAMRWLLALQRALDEIPKAKPRILCLLCDYKFGPRRPPVAFVALTAHVDDPSMALFNGLCQRCWIHGDLDNRILAYYRDNALSDLRRLPPFAAEGHS